MKVKSSAVPRFYMVRLPGKFKYDLCIQKAKTGVAITRFVGDAIKAALAKSQKGQQP